MNRGPRSRTRGDLDNGSRMLLLSYAGADGGLGNGKSDTAQIPMQLWGEMIDTRLMR